MKNKPKGKKNIILAVCAIIIAILLLASFFITVNFSANTKDLQLYRMAGALLLATFEIGILLEMNLFGLCKKIPLISGTSIFKHILFWFVIVFIACILFSIPYSLTSAEFKEQLNKKEVITTDNDTLVNNEELEETVTTELIQENKPDNTIETTPTAPVKKALTWQSLSKEAGRYKLVLTLLGEHFNKGEYADSDFSDLSLDEKKLVEDLFSYANANNELPMEFTETFTAFCVGKEFENMFLEAYDNPFYKSLSNSFVISWKSDGTYYIGIKEREDLEQTESEDTNRFVGKTGCEFTVSEPFELDGVTYTISRIKICSKMDSESPSYNYYKIFYEYTIENNRKESIEWDMAYNGNLYGLLCHKGAERKLGGNNVIKDDSFDKSKYAPEGTLAAGATISGYNSVICQPDLLDFPAETWPLYTDEPFSLILHLVVNSTDYSLTISFN